MTNNYHWLIICQYDFGSFFPSFFLPELEFDSIFPLISRINLTTGCGVAWFSWQLGTSQLRSSKSLAAKPPGPGLQELMDHWTINPMKHDVQRKRFPYIWCKRCKHNTFFMAKGFNVFSFHLTSEESSWMWILHLLLKTHSRLVAMGQDDSKKLRLNQISSGSSIEQHPCRPSYNFHAARNSWKLLENLIYLRPLS